MTVPGITSAYLPFHVSEPLINSNLIGLKLVCAGCATCPNTATVSISVSPPANSAAQYEYGPCVMLTAYPGACRKDTGMCAA
jgi:hypothetical protein